MIVTTGGRRCRCSRSSAPTISVTLRAWAWLGGLDFDFQLFCYQRDRRHIQVLSDVDRHSFTNRILTISVSATDMALASSWTVIVPVSTSFSRSGFCSAVSLRRSCLIEPDFLLLMLLLPPSPVTPVQSVLLLFGRTGNGQADLHGSIYIKFAYPLNPPRRFQ